VNNDDGVIKRRINVLIVAAVVVFIMVAKILKGTDLVSNGYQMAIVGGVCIAVTLLIELAVHKLLSMFKSKDN
jgi:hypothetical protein